MGDLKLQLARHRAYRLAMAADPLAVEGWSVAAGWWAPSLAEDHLACWLAVARVLPGRA